MNKKSEQQKAVWIWKFRWIFRSRSL